MIAMQVEVKISNIVKQEGIQAVVNSANANLRLGSGVAGAIHGAAGIKLEKYCEQFAPLGFGKAIITPAFNLPNEFVIHTRAANYLLDDNAEAVLVECLNAVFALANENSITSIAIPAIGTGVFKFPLELCASITAMAIKAHAGGSVQLVRICVTDDTTQSVFLSALAGEGVQLAS
jgi:O-acetyl-ADP-ribose deacetylase (regulator of RNase III)